MKRLIVKYKDVALGELSYNNNVFCYNVFEKNIQQANENGYPIMLYKVDKDFIDQTLPLSLNNMIPDEGTNLYKSAGITQFDNDYEKLLKIASLPLYDEGLYVVVED